jgi:hypothetical protein
MAEAAAAALANSRMSPRLALLDCPAHSTQGESAWPVQWAERGGEGRPLDKGTAMPAPWTLPIDAPMAVAGLALSPLQW